MKNLISPLKLWQTGQAAITTYIVSSGATSSGIPLDSGDLL
jgi:hypothetical protein